MNDFEQGYGRRRCGRGFCFLSTQGKPISSERVKKRLKNLAIPPAWEEVWICPKTNGHIQARGLDDAGRTQYIYHPQWHAISSAKKFDRMHLFAEVLGRLRRRVRKDLNRRKLNKSRVLAAVVRLLDRAQLRVGNQRYVEERNSRGATTLGSDHVELDGVKIKLDFPAKSGKRREIAFSDKKTAAVISQCEEIDGQYLFCYSDGAEDYSVTSSDVNDYLKSASKESITAKDFRTWWGSVVALASVADQREELPESSKSARKKLMTTAVKAAATHLGNTPAVCRSSYIHPAILAATESGELVDLLDNVDETVSSIPELSVDEIRFANLLPHLNF